MNVFFGPPPPSFALQVICTQFKSTFIKSVRLSTSTWDETLMHITLSITWCLIVVPLLWHKSEITLTELQVNVAARAAECQGWHRLITTFFLYLSTIISMRKTQTEAHYIREYIKMPIRETMDRSLSIGRRYAERHSCYRRTLCIVCYDNIECCGLISVWWPRG